MPIRRSRGSPSASIPRIKAMVGDTAISRSTGCRSTHSSAAGSQRFVHGRVIFAGDSAHVVSPFGARGGNGGIQDADNLGWKLAAVLKGEAPRALLESYNAERIHGADENILNSSRATNFMTPKSRIERLFRDEVLALAKCIRSPAGSSIPAACRGPARSRASRWVRRTRRTSAALWRPARPASMRRSATGKAMTAGCSIIAAVISSHWASATCRQRQRVCVGSPSARRGDIEDPQGLVTARYGGAPGVVYLIRPDQHVAARFINPSAAAIAEALHRANGNDAA